MKSRKLFTLPLTLAILMASVVFDGRTICFAEASEEPAFSFEPGVPVLMWTLMKDKVLSLPKEAMVDRAESAMNRAGLTGVRKNYGDYPGAEGFLNGAHAIIALVRHPKTSTEWGYVWLVLVAGEKAISVRQKLIDGLNAKPIIITPKKPVSNPAGDKKEKPLIITPPKPDSPPGDNKKKPTMGVI